MIKAFRSRQFLLFLLTGGFAAGVNFVSRIVLSQWLDFTSAIVTAYMVGMVTAFTLGRLFVFKGSQQSVHRSALFFFLVNVLGVTQTWLISMGMAYYALPALGLKVFVREVAHGVGLLAPVFTSYLGHKHLSFR
jgi:putative flippase GtrA